MISNIYSEFGKLSPELNSVLQVGFFASFFGALYGGINQSKVAYLNFIDNNQATAFKTHFEAKVCILKLLIRIKYIRLVLSLEKVTRSSNNKFRERSFQMGLEIGIILHIIHVSNHADLWKI